MNTKYQVSFEDAKKTQCIKCGKNIEWDEPSMDIFPKWDEGMFIYGYCCEHSYSMTGPTTVQIEIEKDEE